ncbi:MAG: Hsp20/alpha crystallin family protein [Thermodesulfobacteriota bacterium]
MDLIKIRLGEEMKDIRDQMEQMMDEFMRIQPFFSPKAGTHWVPPMDIYETNAGLFILLEMAGLSKEDIQVVMDPGVLRIYGRRPNPIQEECSKVLRMEIEFGPFERRIRIQTPIDPDGIDAVYRDGFLRIWVPKARVVEREISVGEGPP